MKYYDYLAVTAFLDESPVIRLSASIEAVSALDGLVPDVTADFTSACCEYRKRLSENCAHYAQANSIRDNQLDSYLYNPALFLAFGKGDSIALVLVDDFDPLISITMDIESPVTTCSLAFCPDLSSLDMPTSVRGYFKPLHAILDGEAPAAVNANGRAPMYKPSTHRFQTQQPLLMRSDLTFNGLASLGGGLTWQDAIANAVAIKIDEVLCELRQKAQTASFDLYTSADLKPGALTFTLLDPQEHAGFTLLMFANNYSVATAVLQGIRSLTIGDVANSDVKAVVHASDGHAVLWDLAAPFRQEKKAPSIPFEGNHVFSRTHSTLAVSYPAFEDPDSVATPSGYLRVTASLNVNPGHFPAVEARLLEAVPQLRHSYKPCTLPEQAFRLFTVGSSDLDLHLPSDLLTFGKGTDMIRTRDFINLTRTLLETFRISHPHLLAEDKTPEQWLRDTDETGLTDLCSNLTIPYPSTRAGKNPFSACPFQHHEPLMAILMRLRMMLFYDRGGTPRANTPRSSARFNQQFLESRMRPLGIPKSMRRTIAYMYQDFSNCLADPFLFDGVLDLYDAFATLYEVLTDFLPRQFARCAPSERAYFFKEHLIDELSAHIDALQNAMIHRVSGREQADARDMSVDFRGGLNNLVSAVDVPMKCGLGLIRLISPSLTRRHLAGITHFSMHPRTVCRRPNLGKQADIDPQGAPRLTHVRIDVRHLFSPAEFINYLHETAHVLLDVILRDDVILSEDEPANTSLLTSDFLDGENLNNSAAMAERIEEVIVGQLTHYLVFRGDWKLFLKHYVSAYSLQPASNSGSELQAMASFCEVMIRGFLIVDPISRLVKVHGDDPRAWESHPDGQLDDEGEVVMQSAEARDRFLSIVEEFGIYFRRADQFFSAGYGYKDYCIGQFEDIYPRALPKCSSAFHIARDAYRVFASEKFPLNAGLASRQWAAFVEAVGDAFDSGVPLFPVSSVRRWFGFEADEEMVDDLILLCELLRKYFEFCYDGSEGRSFHLQRNITGENPTGEVDYSLNGSAKQWHRFQLDTAYGKLFCADVNVRRNRVLREIVIMKSLWGISTKLRSRRLGELYASTR